MSDGLALERRGGKGWEGAGRGGEARGGGRGSRVLLRKLVMPSFTNECGVRAGVGGVRNQSEIPFLIIFFY